MATDRPNLIILCPDEMRAESLACYGHPAAITPNIDRLAGEGVRFDNCFVQHTVCSPSRCSYLTGLYPHNRGHRTLWHLLQPDEPDLFQRLKDDGYETVYWGKNDTYSPGAALNAISKFGRHSSQAKRGSRGWMPPHDLDDPMHYSFLYEPMSEDRREHHDWQTLHGAVEYLQSAPTEPFALNVNLGFPHCPYHAPADWHDRIDPDSLPPLRPRGLPNKPDFHTELARQSRTAELPDDVLRKINAVYLGMIGFVDEMVGDLMRALDETGLADNTVLMLISDHGDFAGDFGLVEKWPSALDDTVTRVPLIIRAPGNAAGHVVEEPIELFDITATGLDVCGVEAKHTHFARSLAPQLAGAAGDPERVVFAEGGYDTHEPQCFENPGQVSGGGDVREAVYWAKTSLQQEKPETVCRATMARSATHKLVQRPNGVDELYDLRSDPQELKNVHGDPAHSEAQRELELAMLNWYVHTSDTVPFEQNERGFTKEVREALS